MCDKQYLPFRKTSASNLLKILTPIFQYYLWHYVIHREISDFCVLLLCISLSRSCSKEKKINRKLDVVDHDLCMKYFLFRLLYTIYITDDSRAISSGRVLSTCCHGYNYIRRQKRSRDLFGSFFLHLFQEADVTRD